MKVIFVYSGGREDKRSDGPSDFFYGAKKLASDTRFEIEYVDLDASPADPLTALVGGVFGKWLPPRTSADWIARCRRVLPRLRNVDVWEAGRAWICKWIDIASKKTGEQRKSLA